MILRNHEGVKSKSDIYRVDPRSLLVDPGFNVRDLDAPTARDKLDQLKDSIRSEGVQDPVEIRLQGGSLYIVSGHRRLKCVMELIAEGHDIETIPAIAEPKMISDAERTARMQTLNSGEPLSALEKAEIVRRLLNYGWSREKVTRYLGLKTVQTIANYELLLGSSEEIQAAVRTGELSATSAVDITRASNGSATQAKETLSRARTEAKVSGKGNGKVTTQSVTRALGASPRGASRASRPDKPHYMADLDKAIALLRSVSNGTLSAKQHAELYIGNATDLTDILDWFYEFVDAVKLHRDERSTVKPIAKENDGDESQSVF